MRAPKKPVQGNPAAVSGPPQQMELPGEIQVIIRTLENQRNAALANQINLEVRIFQLEKAIEELTEKLKVAGVKPPVVPPSPPAPNGKAAAT